MRFHIKLGRLGKKPQPDWTDNGTLMIKMPIAENHNYNEGTRENPEWVTKSTSWFNMEAWADLAEDIMDMDLDEGDAVEIRGIHKKRKQQTENEKARYYDVYTIKEIEKYTDNEE